MKWFCTAVYPSFLTNALQNEPPTPCYPSINSMLLSVVEHLDHSTFAFFIIGFLSQGEFCLLGDEAEVLVKHFGLVYRKQDLF